VYFDIAKNANTVIYSKQRAIQQFSEFCYSVAEETIAFSAAQFLYFFPFHDQLGSILNLQMHGPPVTYRWTRLLILDHSYLVGNLTNSKIVETKALEPLKS
jgi:hypothetical protein